MEEASVKMREGEEEGGQEMGGNITPMHTAITCVVAGIKG